MTYDVIIIGAGPAGLTAAIYAVRAGLSTLILEAQQVGGQVAISAEIENYPGAPRTTGWQLASAMDRQVRDMDVPIRHEAVTAIADLGRTKQVITTAGTYTAGALILANGAKRRKIGIPGEEALFGRGVSYCPTCDGNFFRGRDVAVVGGGNTAVEDAVYLSGLCAHVHLIYRREVLTAQKPLIAAARSRENLHLHPGARVTAIQGGGTVEAVEVAGVRGGEPLLLPVSGVFIAIGLEPDNGIFAPTVALDQGGYLQAGEDCKTSCPGIFCAGDARTKPLRQIVTAASDGAVAAMQAERYLSALGGAEG